MLMCVRPVTLKWGWGNRSLGQTSRYLLRFFNALITGVLLMVSAGTSADTPRIPKGKGEFCVEPTEIMRKDHMKFLLHQRDRTVHDGIRSKQHSLKECVDCHVQTNQSGEFIPVDAPEQFCQTCHDFASVKLDCFECHATTPDEGYSALNTLLPEGHNISAMTFFKTRLPDQPWHGELSSAEISAHPSTLLP